MRADFCFNRDIRSGFSGGIPARASAGAIPQVKVSTLPYPVGMNSGESKLIPYQLSESNVSGEITSRRDRFYTQFGVPLSGTTIRFASREAGANAPQLIIETAP